MSDGKPVPTFPDIALVLPVIQPPEGPRRDAVVDLDIPEHGAIRLLIGGEELIELAEVVHPHRLDADGAGDGGKVRPSEDGMGVVDLLRPEAMDLGAVGAVVVATPILPVVRA